MSRGGSAATDERLGLPSVAQCREQRDRILKSPDFQASARDRKFLTYVVEETLAGRSERIKAYSIAVEVFGRDSSFDPQSDPVVRMEAGHLRRALANYYLRAGHSDPIVITIPKGHYVPMFTVRSLSSPRPSSIGYASTAEVNESTKALKLPPRKWLVVSIAVATALVFAIFFLAPSDRNRRAGPDVPHLLVIPFDDLSGTSNSSTVARGLTQEVISQVAKFRDIVVTEGMPRSDLGPTATDFATSVRFALAGSVEVAPNELRLRVRVTDYRSGSILWANSYRSELRVGELLSIEAEIARQVATIIAQPYGVIFQADAARQIENPPDDWEAYYCTLAYYNYRANLYAETHPVVRKCLEEAVARFPNYATAWALLSQTYIDEIRFRYPVGPSFSPTSIDRALEVARRAVELDPQNIRGLQAEMLALYFNTQIEAALKVGELALATNPNDTELMGEYGFRLAMSGEWNRGCSLVTEATERNSGPLAYYEAALALCSYFGGDYERAAMWIKKTTIPSNPVYHSIAAAIFGEGGYKSDADRERDWLVNNEPDLVKNMRREVEARFARPKDVEKFLGSLRKAGIAIPE